MVLIPYDSCSAKTEIKVNIRKALVGLIVIKVPAIETEMGEWVIGGCGAKTEGQ